MNNHMRGPFSCWRPNTILLCTRVVPGKQQTVTNDFFVDKCFASILYNIKSPKYASFSANDPFLVDYVASVLCLLLLSCSFIIVSFFFWPVLICEEFSFLDVLDFNFNSTNF